MQEIIRKFRYLIITKDTPTLCSIICAMHLFLAPVCFYNNFIFISQYHLYTAIIYVILIAISKALPQAFLFEVAYIESIIYTLLVTNRFGRDCGSYILTLALITYLAIISIKAQKISKTLIIPIVLTFIEILSIQIFSFVSIEHYKPLSKDFYLLHYSVYAGTSLAIFCFESFLIQGKISRFLAKNTMRTKFLKYSSTHDALTKILNRREMMHQLNSFAADKQFKEDNFSIAIFDIDNFKKINDAYGHTSGDIALQKIASLVQEDLSPETIFARWGGEEFLILFNKRKSVSFKELEEIRKKIESTKIKLQTEQIKLTITIGLSQTGTPENFSKMLIEADNNLMHGKTHGKNCVIYTK